MRSLVPAYFHPAEASEAWSALKSADMMVLNVASGPGTAAQPDFAAAVAALRAAGVRVLGYVDAAYGRRPHDAILDEAARYRAWYGADGVFLDQVPSGPGDLPAHQALVTRLPVGGVVANHGVYPEPGYAACADLLVVFEGPLAAYRDVRPPGWALRPPAARFCHLVYGVPAAALPEVRRRAAAGNAGVLYATDRAGANPYDGLPAYFAGPPDGHGRLTT